jgi:hypothetical protein
MAHLFYILLVPFFLAPRAASALTAPGVTPLEIAARELSATRAGNPRGDLLNDDDSRDQDLMKASSALALVQSGHSEPAGPAQREPLQQFSMVRDVPPRAPPRLK